MRINFLKAILKTSVRGTTVLLLGAGVASAQPQKVNLTAAATSTTLPDGSSVPMWGYSCDATQPTGTIAACAALNKSAGGGWSPVIITVPSGQDLQINLTNSLPAPVPTSLVIVGQLGGGAGSPGGTTPAPDHSLAQTTTWPIADPGTTGTPPTQGPRVQSFGKEVKNGDPTTALLWTNPRPGTYLLESGTHPSIQGPMGLIGMVVVTTAPVPGPSALTSKPGIAYPGINYNADVPVLLSEIDPVQNRAVDKAVGTTGFSESATLNPSLAAGGQLQPAMAQCSGGAAACYPPVVNYTPLYYLVNGTAFNKTNPNASLIPASPVAGVVPGTGRVLVRMVNAGSRMHVPSIVGSVTGTATAPATPPAGFSLIAEDGNPLPGVPRVQSEVFLAAGKTYDVMINAPAAGGKALPVYDRELSLSANASVRDAGMFAYIGVNGAGVPSSPSLGGSVVAADDNYTALIAGNKLTVSDPLKGVIANDTNVFGATLLQPPANGTVTLNDNGTFTYVPTGTTLTCTGSGTSALCDTFTYCANGSVTGGVCSSGKTATVNLRPSNITDTAGIILCNDSSACNYRASTAVALLVKAPGILASATDGANLPVTVDTASLTAVSSGLTVTLDPSGAFIATLSSACTTPTGCATSFKFTAKNALGTVSDPTVVNVVFPPRSGLNVKVMDGADKSTILTDYRWIIEEDRTFFVDPACTQNPVPSGCPKIPNGAPPNFGTNFHTSHMPVVATGCTGDISCGSGQTSQGIAVAPHPASLPGDVALCPSPNPGGITNCLDPTKRYYISVLPGDAAQPFLGGTATAPTDCAKNGSADPSNWTQNCGHGMGGAPIAKLATDTKTYGGQTVTVWTEPSPYPPATLTVFVFQDDYPLNGEHDAGGGIDVLSPNEAGLGGFQITLQDDAGGTGDATGTPTYDMFNMPLSNSLAGTIDPVSKLDACPISAQDTANAEMSPATQPATPDQCSNNPNLKGCQKGIAGMIVTCPKYESDGHTMSPLAGQAVVKNLYQGRYGVVANPGADRIGRGEEWLQTNTLDGQKAHDSFMRIGEPGYFQEFGPAGYHVTIGFANPKIINDRWTQMCPGGIGSGSCTYEVKGHITTARMSRTPDERLYGSGTHDSYGFTQCYVSIGDPDGAEFGFQKCDGDGNFDFKGLPPGNWKITTFDQWNDQVVDGITTATGLCDKSLDTTGASVYTCPNKVRDMGEVAVHQWQSNIYTRTFLDPDYTGVSQDPGNAGLPLVSTNIRFRDGSYSNFNSTDLNGYAGFNEVFPLFNWYVIETDSTRYKNTGIHVVYDSGGPVDIPTKGTPQSIDCTAGSSTKPCEKSDLAAYFANTYEPNPLPADLHVPGAVYCTNADCGSENLGTAIVAKSVGSSSPSTNSTGRIDPPWVEAEGWQGFSGQNNFLEFGKKPFVPGENGGIHGHVVYASTRPFDDPQLLLQLSWEPMVPNVKINLYQEGVAADGITPTLKLVDQTETSSFDKWSQGFRSTETGVASFTVTNGGAGYTSAPTVTLSGGATAKAVVSNGKVTEIYLTNSGTGYATPPTVNISGGGATTNASAIAVLAGGGLGVPNMSCPGQGIDDPASVAPDPFFYFALKDQPQYLDLYANGTAGAKSLPYQSRYKCYDGMHNWNQLQPAPYDGMYRFPSITSIDPVTGAPLATNCKVCVTNPDKDDPYRYGGSTQGTWSSGHGAPMLPPGKYVVEVVVPDGFELVKEEDKNILIGDNFIAPITQQFGGLGAIYILPDQASVAETYNGYNPQSPNTDQGRTTLPSTEADTGSDEQFWPCAGAERTVPDFISLFPLSQEVAPFAGATRRLCDRKEVTLADQASVLAKFYVFTETHAAAHFTGVITDDFTAEFDPFSPQFGEKYGPAYLPVQFKDWAGNDLERVYSDAWGSYNGLSYSTWEVNPPNPTGYGPTMLVGCMNDAGQKPDGTNDPLFQEGYSQFCYELPFMPSQTGYFDTPVVPTAAFAGGYNNPDCAYADLTPAIKEVDGDVIGPWVAGAGGAIQSVSISNGGTGYTSAPAVGFTGGGSGATATATISGSVSTITVGNPTTNRGYSTTTAPTVVIGAPAAGGTQATATANMIGSVTSVTVTTRGVYQGTFLTPPAVTVNITGNGTGVNATATMGKITVLGTTWQVTGVTINNAGTGYTGTASVSFTSTGTTTAAQGTVQLGRSVRTVTVNAAGSGYGSAPSVTFSGGGTPVTAASATSAISGSVVSIAVTNAGGGYSGTGVTLTGGGGSGAIATATLSSGGKLTISSLGKQLVDNYEYVGPSAATAPYNQQKITRNYGFGTAPAVFTGFPTLTAPQHYNCNAGNDGTAVCPYVTIGGLPMTSVAWADGQISGNVPQGVPFCPVQQQARFSNGASLARCGELVITAANGKTSVDTVTVTIGGKKPTPVTANLPLTASGIGSIQDAIDKASPGDMLMIGPGTHQEMILMWKPVRLQGVGAASSIIDANTQPAGKLNPWRQKAVCLFGLALNGTPISGTNPYNPDTTTPGAATCTADQQFQVDRLPLEATVGWDATLNGNLAEQLIEPTLLGAYEGAGITVLAKGVYFSDPSHAFDSDTFPTDATLLNNSLTDNVKGCGPTNPNKSNYYCNPSSIDGLTVKNSSQGGGGIFVHGWAHELQIANNRITNNQGTMSGGITIGQGEHPDAYLQGGAANTVPGSCISPSALTTAANLALPYCFNVDVNVHNNSVTQNASLGDELFSSTPAGAGGVTFCNGSDYYKFDYNWVCGNMSTGDGAGVAHVGFSYDGDIQHNTISFNQSTNPSIVTNGGGLLIMGAPDADPPCGTTTDVDCVSSPGTITPSDGTGPALVINANLIQGNSADSGSGGGLRLQHINGNEVVNFPTGTTNPGWPSIPVLPQPAGVTVTPRPAQPAFQTATAWNSVLVNNNIISNNVAGWDGGGISLQDALAVNIVNNTIIANNSTASSGVLFQSLFAPLSSAPDAPGAANSNCSHPTKDSTGKVILTEESCAQPAGLVSVTNSAVLTANLPATITCPANHGSGANGDCRRFSVPALNNNIFWHNRSLVIHFNDSLPTANSTTNQNYSIQVYNPGFAGAASTQAIGQVKTGGCDTSGDSYWDIGVRGDTGPGNHTGGTLSPTWSLLTNLSEIGNGTNNITSIDPTLTGTYCNGSLVPVEGATSVPGSPYAGWLAPPGTNESNGLPAPPFTLQAAGTVDEGNNWINLRWGPLSTNVLDGSANAVFTFDPRQQAGSPVIDYIPVAGSTPNNIGGVPTLDFYGHARPDTSTANHPRFDIGAVEFQAAVTTPILVVTPSPVAFGNVVAPTNPAPTQTITLRNDGGATATGIVVGTIAAGSPFTRSGNTCGATLAASATCTITITFNPTTTGNFSASLTITSTNATVNGAPVPISGTGVAIIRSASVTPSPLDFENWATGTTSIMNLTVTNTGNVQLTGGAATNPAAPFSRITTGTFPANAPNCGATLNVGSSCTIKVQFAPTATGPFSTTTTVSYGGTNPATTVTPTPVQIKGSGVAGRATVNITPSPITINVPAGTPTGGATVTFTNTSPTGGSSVAVSSVAVAPALGLGYGFSKPAGADNCTGANLAPGASCTVDVQVTRILITGTRTGTITFTDNGTGSPQSRPITATLN